MTNAEKFQAASPAARERAGRPERAAALASLLDGGPRGDVLAAALLGAFLFLAVLVQRAAVSTPFKDEFFFGTLYQAALEGRLPLGELFRPHNGHIYVLAKFAMWAVVRLGLPFDTLDWLQLPLLAGAAWAFIAFARRHFELSTAGCLAAIAVVLSPNQWANLYWAMEIAVALMLFFAMLAFERAGRYVQDGADRHALQAMGFALLAMCSQGAGMVVAVLVAAIVLVNRRSRLAPALAGADAALLVLLYAGSQALGPQESSVPGLPAGAWAGKVPGYLASYFGSVAIPAEAFGSRAAERMVGAAFFAATAALLWIHRARLRPGAPVLWIGVFAVLTAAGICVSRLSTGVNEPDAPRYFSMAGLGWLGLLCLGASAGRSRRSWQALILCVVLFGYVSGATSEFTTSPYRKVYLQQRQDALCAGRTEGLAFGAPEMVDLEPIRRSFCR